MLSKAINHFNQTSAATLSSFALSTRSSGELSNFKELPTLLEPHSGGSHGGRVRRRCTGGGEEGVTMACYAQHGGVGKQYSWCIIL